MDHGAITHLNILYTDCTFLFSCLFFPTERMNTRTAFIKTPSFQIAFYRTHVNTLTLCEGYAMFPAYLSNMVIERSSSCDKIIRKHPATNVITYLSRCSNPKDQQNYNS
jgi:hypothetical protein